MRVIMRDILDAPLPIEEAAEVIPEVETIHVDILGTVSMVSAPMINVPITIPKERTPFPANTLSFSMLAPDVPTSSW